MAARALQGSGGLVHMVATLSRHGRLRKAHTHTHFCPSSAAKFEVLYCSHQARSVAGMPVLHEVCSRNTISKLRLVLLAPREDRRVQSERRMFPQNSCGPSDGTCRWRFIVIPIITAVSRRAPPCFRLRLVRFHPMAQQVSMGDHTSTLAAPQARLEPRRGQDRLYSQLTFAAAPDGNLGSLQPLGSRNRKMPSAFIELAHDPTAIKSESQNRGHMRQPHT